jgi:predicted DNA-binding transcriptional regulator YafY
MGLVLDTSVRLLRLLALLPTRPTWSGPELAERLGVTTRTVRNDVERLRILGYEVRSAPGTAGGYRLGSGAALPPLLLDDEEAAVVAVSLRAAATGSITGVEDAARRALVKLDTVLPARLRARADAMRAAVASAPVGGPAVDARLLADVAAAVAARTGLRLDYRAHDGTSTRRAVEPYRLVHVGRRWYLLAFDLDRDDWRTFRVDRLSLRTPGGPHFVPRPVPGGDAVAHVVRGVGSIAWAHPARVRRGGPGRTGNGGARRRRSGRVRARDRGDVARPARGVPAGPRRRPHGPRPARARGDAGAGRRPSLPIGGYGHRASGTGVGEGQPHE